MRAPDKPLTDFEDGLIRKVVIPLMLIGFAYFLFSTSLQSRQCKKACHSEGYAEHRFHPEGRYGVTPAACYCLTAEEASDGATIYKGRQIQFKSL